MTKKKCCGKYEGYRVPLPIKTKYHWVPPEVDEEIAKNYMDGATKHEPNGFRKGVLLSEHYNALRRHLAAFWSGQERTTDSNIHHLACVATRAQMMLLQQLNIEKYKEFDDRYKNEENT